jgi:integrase
MNLLEAIEFTREHRDAWREGRGAATARINSNHCVRILGADLPIDEVASKHFAQLTTQLKKEGKAPATINRITAALSTVITELRQHGFKLDEVAYKRQVEPKGRPGFYTEDEIQKMLSAASKWPDHMLMHDSLLFAIKTGCRQRELLTLTIHDVDFDNQLITFRDVKTAHSTGINDHSIKMHDDLIPALARRFDALIGKELFAWRDKDQLLRRLRTLQREAGITEDRCWHSLRHTTATWLLERDVPIRAVMGVLNHSNINTTLRYAKYTDRAVAAAIDKI